MVELESTPRAQTFPKVAEFAKYDPDFFLKCNEFFL